jgi:hypothetical protein
MWWTMAMAWAADVQVPIAGWLGDPSGAGATGSRTVVFSVTGDAAGVDVLDAYTDTVEFSAGSFSVLAVLDEAHLAVSDERYLKVTVDGQDSAAVPIGWVPRAAFARRADLLGALPAEAYTLDSEAVAWSRVSSGAGIPAAVRDGYTAGAGLTLTGTEFRTSAAYLPTSGGAVGALTVTGNLAANAGLSVASGQSATFGGPASFNGGLSVPAGQSAAFAGPANFNGGLSVPAGQSAAFGGPANFNGGLSVPAGQSAAFAGPANFNGGLSVPAGQSAAFAGPANFNGGLSVPAGQSAAFAGPANFNGGLSVPAGQTATFNGPITAAGLITSAAGIDFTENGGTRNADFGRILIRKTPAMYEISVPWTPAFVLANVDRTYKWTALGPDLWDDFDCGSGPLGAMDFDYVEGAAVDGAYSVTFFSYGGAPAFQFRWSGWQVQLRNGANTVLADGTAWVEGQFRWDPTEAGGGRWELQHMLGQVQTTLFECR